MSPHLMNILHPVCALPSSRPQGDEGEFFVQLFLEADPALQLPSIHQLLAKMFTEQDIKFSKVVPTL